MIYFIKKGTLKRRIAHFYQSWKTLHIIIIMENFMTCTAVVHLNLMVLMCISTGWKVEKGT